MIKEEDRRKVFDKFLSKIQYKKVENCDVPVNRHIQPGKDVNDGEEYSAWSDRDFAEDCALEAGWIRDELDEDKHYCTICYSYDDNDNLVLREISNNKLL